MRAGIAVAILGLAVTLKGGAWAWNAVNEFEAEAGRVAAVEGRMDDIRATVDAQLDEAVGQASVTASFPDSETDLAGLIDDLVLYAEADPAGGHRDEILRLHREVLRDADSDGVLDERLVAGLSDALRDLERDVVIPLGSDDAYDNAYQRTVLVAVASLILWAAALVIAIRTRSARAEPSIPG